MGVKRDVSKRFWTKVAKTDEHLCWLWTGAKYRNGYGGFGVNRNGLKMTGAHRMSWELAHGPIPPGLDICHRCDVPACVNPTHLFLGTTQDNMRDKIAKGRDHNLKRTQCKLGHSLSGDNLLFTIRGARLCRICRNHKNMLYKRMLRAKVQKDK